MIDLVFQKKRRKLKSKSNEGGKERLKKLNRGLIIAVSSFPTIQCMFGYCYVEEKRICHYVANLPIFPTIFPLSVGVAQFNDRLLKESDMISFRPQFSWWSSSMDASNLNFQPKSKFCLQSAIGLCAVMRCS